MESTAFFIRISIRLYIFCLLIKNFKPSFQLLSYLYWSVWLKNILGCIWYFSNTSKCSWRSTVSLLCQFSLFKKKKMIQSQVFSAIASPGTCGKLRKDWDTNLWNVFSLPLTVEIFHLFECHLMIMVRKHIPVIVVWKIHTGNYFKRKKEKGKIVVFLTSELSALVHIHFGSSCLLTGSFLIAYEKQVGKPMAL